MKELRHNSADLMRIQLAIDRWTYCRSNSERKTGPLICSLLAHAMFGSGVGEGL